MWINMSAMIGARAQQNQQNDLYAQTLLCALWVTKDPKLFQADSENTDPWAHRSFFSFFCSPAHLCTLKWFQMSNIVQFDLKPTPETSLHNMLEYGLSKHLSK